MSDKHYSFKSAMKSLREGKMIARQEWMIDGIFIFQQLGNIVDKSYIPNFKSLPESVKEKLISLNIDIEFNSSISMFDSEMKIQPGWIAFDEDLDANDWLIL